MKQLQSSKRAPRGSKQHRKPCADCPWARTALPGWLGPLEVEEWVQVAHGDDPVMCHTREPLQCAGVAIYRKNVCKNPRNPETLRLDKDHDAVFSTPTEFEEYHERRPEVRNTRRNQTSRDA